MSLMIMLLSCVAAITYVIYKLITIEVDGTNMSSIEKYIEN